MNDVMLFHLLLCLVDVRAALAEVEVCFVLLLDTFDLEQRRCLVLVVVVTAIAREDGLDVETTATLRRFAL